MRPDEGVDVAHQGLCGGLLPQPGRDDARAPLRMRFDIEGVVQSRVVRLIRPRKRPFHVVRQRRQPDRLRAARRDPVEPDQRLGQVAAVERVLLDHPRGRRLDQGGFVHKFKATVSRSGNSNNTPGPAGIDTRPLLDDRHGAHRRRGGVDPLDRETRSA